MAAVLEPVFARVTADKRDQYNTFFQITNPANIQKYASGSSLTNLVDLAEKVIDVIDRTNPIWDTYHGPETDRATAIAARQWQLNRISDVKQRIAQAMTQKKAFYENDWLGIVTKFVLKCFCMWNNGISPSISKAEDLLINWDSRVPLFKKNGSYTPRYFFCLIPVRWVQQNLDTTNFYNYTPSRTIQFSGTFGLADNPVIPPGFIRV